ncbi:MAG: glycerophosphodiester phosphodiesterase family protein [Pseudomonadota bacterium]
MERIKTAVLAAFVAMPTIASAATMGPEIWSHRGASYLSFENTLEAFEVGADLGATGYELDLVLTRDDQLAVYHDLTLSESTNVEDLFGPERARADGEFYVRDFDMDELRILTLEVSPNDADVRNELALDPANPVGQAPDYVYRIPSYDEALDLAEGKLDGQKVLTEVKLEEDGSPGERALIIDLLVGQWETRGYVEGASPVVVQSFSQAFMAEIDARLAGTDLDVPTYQLDALMLTLDGAPETQEGLNALVADLYGDLDGLALFAGLYLTTDAPFQEFVNPAELDFVEAASLAGLETYVWTLSLPDGVALDTYYDWLLDPSTPIDFGMQYQELYELGLDGIITDTPDVAVATYRDFITPIPLPAGGLLLLSGLTLLVLRRRRERS